MRHADLGPAVAFPRPAAVLSRPPMVVSGAEKLSAAVYVARRPRSGPKKRPPRPPPGRSRAPAGGAAAA